jgi:cytochrome P450
MNTAEDMAPTIFHGLLNNPKLPDSEQSTDRLVDEARTLLSGGTDTTALTLASLTYHLLANPTILKKLKAELAQALPDAKAMPELAQMEALPYLTAVIQEAIRLHPAVSIRQERVAPDEELFYEDRKSGKKYVIPKGVSAYETSSDMQLKLTIYFKTPAGMSAHLLSRDEDIYPSWSVFNPDRWVENPRLDRYQIAFSRGSRRCLGVSSGSFIHFTG